MEAGHRLWYASSHPHHQYLPAIREHLAGVTSFDLGHVHADPVAWLQRLIEGERIDIVYSLLNAWDGSNEATAALLRRGCLVPVVRHYKEHLLSPTDDEQVCMEHSAGVIVITPCRATTSRGCTASRYGRRASTQIRRACAGGTAAGGASAEERRHTLGDGIGRRRRRRRRILHEWRGRRRRGPRPAHSRRAAADGAGGSRPAAGGGASAAGGATLGAGGGARAPGRGRVGPKLGYEAGVLVAPGTVQLEGSGSELSMSQTRVVFGMTWHP